MIFIALLENVDILAGTLKTLLNLKIEAEIKQNKGATLFRSSDSVAEHLLTWWLTLSIYEQIKKTKTGSALFKLHIALKTVVQSGPVDQLTLNSKYSLSEEHLLRWHKSPLDSHTKSDADLHSTRDSLDDKPYSEIMVMVCGPRIRGLPVWTGPDPLSASQRSAELATLKSRTTERNSSLHRALSHTPHEHTNALAALAPRKAVTLGGRKAGGRGSGGLFEGLFGGLGGSIENVSGPLGGSIIGGGARGSQVSVPSVIPEYLESVSAAGEAETAAAIKKDTFVKVEDEWLSAKVKLLSCDTITQAKEKILDVLYRLAPFSKRPDASALILESVGVGGSKELKDVDHGNMWAGEFQALNTLEHYAIDNEAHLRLVFPSATTPERSDVQSAAVAGGDSENGTMRLYTSTAKRKPVSKQKTHTRSPSVASNSASTANELNGAGGQERLFHLEMPADEWTDTQIRRNAKQQPLLMKEVYLPRLVATKMPLHGYVDQLLRLILDHHLVPLGVRYWLHWLGVKAERSLGLENAHNTAHVWKSNALLLKVWANILKNPWFILDVRLAPELASHMSVIAQLLIDAASLTAWKLDAHTSTTRLLFSKELPPLNKRVKDLFDRLSPAPSAAGSNETADYCSEQDLFAHTTELLNNEAVHFIGSSAAIDAIYATMNRYQTPLLDAVRVPGGPRRDVRRRLANLFKMRTMPQRLASERLRLENLRRDSADGVQRIASMLD